MRKIKNRINEMVTKSKKELKALYIAYKRKDTPWYAKVFSIIVVGYALSPIDLIPDFIPIIGYLDDFILIPLGIYIAVRLIPKDILKECRSEAEVSANGESKKGWLAAGIILGIWLILLVVLLVKLL